MNVTNDSLLVAVTDDGKIRLKSSPKCLSSLTELENCHENLHSGLSETEALWVQIPYPYKWCSDVLPADCVSVSKWERNWRSRRTNVDAIDEKALYR